MNFGDYTILIVDDEEALRETMVFDFTRKGFKVLEAASGNSALELIKKHKIDLVLSDIRMPDGDGVSLLENIRLVNPDIPVVILVTGYSGMSEADCIKKGAKCVLTKPFDRKMLFQSVVDSLSRLTPKAPASP